MSSSTRRVLILCTGNSARSQMAEGLLRAFDPTLEVQSAGTAPAARVHPAAVQAMSEVGIDISGHWPKSVDEFLGQDFDVVMTVCGHANETCPAFAGWVGSRMHVPFSDPASATGGESAVLAAFRDVRDQIAARLYELYPRIRGWEIRPVSVSDLTTATELLRRCGLPSEGLDEQFGPQYVVCEVGGRTVGLAGVEDYGRDALLRSVAVDESARGSGVGTWLVRNRLEYAQARRFRAVYLLTTTAASWFKRFGFEEVERASAPAGIAGSKEFGGCCRGASLLRLSLEEPIRARLNG